MLQIRRLIYYFSRVKKQTGKSYFRQMVEVVKLIRGRGKLGVAEYFELEVFNDAYFPRSKKADCVGWRASAEIDRCLNRNYWRATANDKVLNYALLQHHGFRIPETVASYSPLCHRVGNEILIETVQALEAFLTEAMPFPVFIKPIHGSYGRGTFLLTCYDVLGKKFTDVNDKKLPLTELLKACTTPQFSGMLFQTCLEPHEDVQRWTGNTTSCVRVIVAVTSQGPKVHLAFWKVARARNITDNFHMGSTGNLLAALDKNTGRVERIVTGLWPGGKSLKFHPDTQQELLGKTLPDWQQAMDMCLRAARCFPGLKLQHWDVAFCLQGPVLMELNTEADLGVAQFLGRTPFLDSDVKRMLEAA